MQKIIKIIINSSLLTLLCIITSLYFVSSAQAACSVVRNTGTRDYCDYNNNFQIDPGEISHIACTNSPPKCCSTQTECNLLPSGCAPGSGFISLGDCLKLSNDTKISDTYSTPAFLVNLIVRNLFVVAGVVLFFMILLAGFKFITGGKKGLDEAKQIMTAALVGFLLMFSAYWIVQIVKIVTKTDLII